jgi:hypothetical protein
LRTTQHQSMIDFDLWLLHPLRQPLDNVSAIFFAKDFVNVAEPRLSLCGVARH